MFEIFWRVITGVSIHIGITSARDDCVSGIEIFPRASCYCLRMPAEDPMNESDEVAALRANANSGDADAQCSLGLAYDTGRGVPQDYVHAVPW
jgi:TPR repeat protein